MSALLEVDDLRIDIPLAEGMLHPVRGVEFSLDRGETLCLVGESGCGKSLTSLALMGLLPPQARRTAKSLNLLDGNLLEMEKPEMAKIRGNRMAMIFQEPMTSLNPSFSIGNQLEEALICHRSVTRGEARERAIYLLERVGITGAAKRLGQYPHQLSGGLRQRAMIAMALMCGPDLIIADEPTTALDVTIQAQILLLLGEFQREFDMGLLLITHDLGVVARIADRVAVMYAGQIIEQGPATAVFNSPLHPYTRGLMACIPVPGKTEHGADLGSIPGLVPTLIGDLEGCAFRDRCPHAVRGCRDFDHLRHIGENHSYRCVMSVEEAKREAQKGPAMASPK